MATFTAIAAGLGVGMSAYGMWKSGQDSQAAANYNAAIYDQQASLIEAKKGLTKEQYARMINKLEGSMVTAVSSSGYDMKGSYLEVMNDSLTQAYLDREVELYNLEVQKRQARTAASESRRTGKAMSTAGSIAAASSLLTEGNTWYQKYGGFGPTKSTPYSTHGAPTSGSRPPAGSGIIGAWGT